MTHKNLAIEAATLNQKLVENIPLTQPQTSGSGKSLTSSPRTIGKSKRRDSEEDENIAINSEKKGKVEHPSKQPSRRSLRKKSQSK